MRWQRGLLLAGINLVAAVPLILLLHAREAQNLRADEENVAAAAKNAAAPKEEAQEKPETVQGEQIVSFNCVGEWIHYPVRIQVVRSGNLPAAALAGWQLDCPNSWTLSGILEGEFAKAATQPNLSAKFKLDMQWRIRQKVNEGLFVLIAIQWLLIGSFPLRQPKKWWAEPGAFITLCTVIGACFTLIPPIDGVAPVPALLSAIAWFWWFGLLIWIALRFLWQQSARMIATRPN